VRPAINLFCACVFDMTANASNRLIVARFGLLSQGQEDAAGPMRYRVFPLFALQAKGEHLLP
jgi:hypothetical protein